MSDVATIAAEEGVAEADLTHLLGLWEKHDLQPLVGAWGKWTGTTLYAACPLTAQLVDAGYMPVSAEDVETAVHTVPHQTTTQADTFVLGYDSSREQHSDDHWSYERHLGRAVRRCLDADFLQYFG